MTTLRTRALVSVAVLVTASAGLGACARGPSHPAVAAATSTQDRALAIRFDNDALEPVDVYLVDEQRQWRLGRVAPGARATLRLPAASLAGRRSFAQLAVVAGEREAPRAARDERARLSIPQPTSEILARRWTYAGGQIKSLRLRSVRVPAGGH